MDRKQLMIMTMEVMRVLEYCTHNREVLEKNTFPERKM